MQRETVQVESEHTSALENMQDAGMADNKSEAARKLFDAGMAEYGFEGGTNGNTRLKQVMSEFTRAFVWIGIALLAVTIMVPVELRVYAFVPFSLAFGSLTVYHFLDKYEPKISNKLRNVIGGETV